MNISSFLLVLYFIYLFCQAAVEENDDDLFSGFYVGNTEHAWEDYGGAWIASKERLVSHIQAIRGITLSLSSVFKMLSLMSILCG